MERFKNLTNQRAFHAVGLIRLLFVSFFLFMSTRTILFYMNQLYFEMTNDTTGHMDFMFIIY